MSISTIDDAFMRAHTRCSAAARVTAHVPLFLLSL